MRNVSVLVSIEIIRALVQRAMDQRMQCYKLTLRSATYSFIRRVLSPPFLWSRLVEPILTATQTSASTTGDTDRKAVIYIIYNTH